MTTTSICKKAMLGCMASAFAFSLVSPAIAQEQTFESDNEQELRQEAFWSTHRDPTGVVRPDLWREGIDQFLRMKAAQLPGLPQPPSQWMQIGPQPLRIDQEQIYQGTGPDSGEVVDIAIDPRGTSDQTVYIATNDGGIWKTTNGGATWTAMTEFSCTGQPANQCPSLSMGAVALDPGNPNIVYAGTGNPFDGGRLITKGVGMYKSTNGGTTWTVLNPGPPPGIFGGHGHNGVSMNRIVVIPSALVSQPSHLLVATNFGLFLSVDGGNNFGSNFPTFNNGSPVLAGDISDLKVDTGVPLLVYAAVSGMGLFSSGDGGITFPVNLFEHQGAPAPGTFTSISFAQSTSTNHKRLFVSVAGLQTPVGNTPFLGLYRSDNYGLTWNYMPGANAAGLADGGCQCAYDLTIGVDPQDEDLLYLGFQELWFSINGGLTFGSQAVTANKVHWDHHAIVFSPPKHRSGKPTRVWVGTDGGISSSQDAGNQWNNLNETIATNLFKHIDIGRGQGDTGFTYGGTQDTGTIEHRPDFSGTNWHLAIDGDGSGVAVDPQDPMSAYGIDVGNYIFTTDGGTTWTIDFNRITPGVWRYAIDPDNPMNLFAIDSATAMNGGSFAPGPNLYLSTDSGANFNLLYPAPAAIRSIRYTNSPEPGFCVKDPKNRNIIWLGLENGSLVHADCPLDDNPMWVQVPDPSGIGNPVGGIEILPDFQSNGDRVVVVYEGFSNTTNPSNHVWYYDGAAWHDISGSLPDLPTHSVYGSVTISNEAGVMTTADLGSTWQVLGTNLATVDSRQLAGGIWPPVLRIGTYGRSTFELNPSNEQGFYDDGLNGQLNAWAIDNGYWVSNSFRAPGSSMGGMTLYVWVDPGDTPLTVDWSISDRPNGMNVFASGTANFTVLSSTMNDFGYLLDEVAFDIPTLPLSIGSTYFVTLQNATNNNGSEGHQVFWDESDGLNCAGSGKDPWGNGANCPSQAFESLLGVVGSESFSVTTTPPLENDPRSGPGSVAALSGLREHLRKSIAYGVIWKTVPDPSEPPRLAAP